MSHIKPNSIHPELVNAVKKAHEIASNPSEYTKYLETCSELNRQPSSNWRHMKPGILVVDKKTMMAFIGDIHGDFNALVALLNATWNLVEGEGLLVFLGDYIDRGYAQLEVISLLLYLKKMYPEKIILLRGNHEPPSWLIPYPHDYPDILRLRFGSNSKKIYEASLSFFESLPLAALVREGGILSLHGGPPTSIFRCSTFECAFEIGMEKASEKLLEEVLWSDPVDMDVDYMPSPRGAGILFGTRATEKVLELAKARYIVRGHEPVDGVEWCHGRRVATVFSSPLVYGLRCAGLLMYNPFDEAGHYIREDCIYLEL